MNEALRLLAILAGLAGVSFAVAALKSASSAAIKHLRTMNPHVVAALTDWRKHYRMAGFLPRQNAASASTAMANMAGTSSMGMSGVNAHLLLSNSSEALPSDTASVSTIFLAIHQQNLPASLRSIANVIPGKRQSFMGFKMVSPRAARYQNICNFKGTNLMKAKDVLLALSKQYQSSMAESDFQAGGDGI